VKGGGSDGFRILEGDARLKKVKTHWSIMKDGVQIINFGK
jgi:hypothetical protein